MQLLADRLVTSPKYPFDPYIERARHLLRLPSKNHHQSQNDVPLVDRFVFDDESFHALAAIGDVETQQIARKFARAPLPTCWIEVACIHCGFLIENDTCVPFVFGGKNIEYPAMEFSLADMRANAETDLFYYFCTEHTERLEPQSACELFGKFTALLLLALSNNRVTTTRTVRPALCGSSAARALRLRRAQRGKPVFSYNQVNLILPKTALHRGELRSTESFAGARMHAVIGHWRLIDGVPEPFWVWIDGYDRGKKELGTIIKQRSVHIIGDIRRGFLVPTFDGRKDMRIPAIRA